MKTIKERASLAAWQIFEEIGLSKHSVERVAEIIEEKIIEQKTIDIEKACDWLFLYVGLYVNDEGYVETHELLRDLSKAMKE